MWQAVRAPLLGAADDKEGFVELSSPAEPGAWLHPPPTGSAAARLPELAWDWS